MSYKNIDWKYRAVDQIEMHDHAITEWEFGKDITLIFKDGFDVYSDCPQNDTGRHKHTGKAAVVLKNGTLVSGKRFFKDLELSVGENDLNGLFIEVIDFKQLLDGVFFACDAFTDGSNNMWFCTLEFSCEEVIFCWNEFTDDAWFQD